MRRQPPAASPDWAYFLDFDGTLVEIAATPDAVTVSPDLRCCLTALYRATGGATAVVSGRSLETLDALLAPVRVALAGLHGAEQRIVPDGAAEHLVEERPLPTATAEALARLTQHHPGVVVEQKGRALAIHFRGAPEAEGDCLDVAEALVRSDPDHWRLLRGKMVVEVKPQQVNKGDAVRRFMTLAPFAGRVPVYIGDDVTDLDGFAACRDLGGHTISVGCMQEDTAAFTLDDPAAVLGWLAGATDCALEESVQS